MKVLGREPIVIVEAVVALLLALSLFFNFNTDSQALVNAAVVAVGAVAQAWTVSAEKALPLLAGAAKAIIALLIGFGVDVPPNVQAAVMAVIAVAVGFFLRGQVVAPTPMQVRSPAVAPEITRTTGGHV